jgi:hypothetical protein
MAYFRPFSNVIFPLKRPVRCQKIPPMWQRLSVTSLTSRASPLCGDVQMEFLTTYADGDLIPCVQCVTVTMELVC